ncbi:MAG TPA: hypothetical protein VD969_11270 [Symbiobacteriaceae bacterium]|nr:hypothetical protein [Symbiobacteriaceae bacterium]
MSTVFLITFFVGFGLTLVSVVLGAIDASGLGHGAGDAGGAHAGDLSHGGVHAGDAGANAGDLSHGAHGDTGGHVASVSPVNFQTLVAFLMGFGGVGYLVGRTPVAGLLLAIPAAVAGGAVTGWLILKWQRFLVRGERPMPPSNYLGVVGKLSVGIREGGTGELVYSLHGTRMVTAARSTDGRPLAKGEQVMVLRYEKGVAYVEPWSGLETDRQQHT